MLEYDFVAKRDMNGAFVEYPKNKYKVGESWIRYIEEKLKWKKIISLYIAF